MRDGQIVVEAPLTYAGEQSTFAGRLRLPSAGPAELQVVASDAANANFGIARRSLLTSPADPRLGQALQPAH